MVPAIDAVPSDLLADVHVECTRERNTLVHYILEPDIMVIA